MRFLNRCKVFLIVKDNSLKNFRLMSKTKKHAVSSMLCSKGAGASARCFRSRLPARSTVKKVLTGNYRRYRMIPLQNSQFIRRGGEYNMAEKVAKAGVKRQE